MYKRCNARVVERLAATVRSLYSESLLGKVLGILGRRWWRSLFTEFENFEGREPGVVPVIGGHGRC